MKSFEGEDACSQQLRQQLPCPTLRRSYQTDAFLRVGAEEEQMRSEHQIRLNVTEHVEPTCQHDVQDHSWN